MTKMTNGLQKEAEELINYLNIDYSNLGEFHLVGNAALGTTVKADIDFQLYPDNLIYRQVAETIKNDLEKKGLKDISIRDLKQSNKFLVTGKFYYKENEWTIDVSITEPQEEYLDDAYTFLKDYYSKINNINIHTIIKLKRHFLSRGMLWNGMSYYIYRTVLDENGTSVKDVFEYLKKFLNSVFSFETQDIK